MLIQRRLTYRADCLENYRNAELNSWMKCVFHSLYKAIGLFCLYICFCEYLLAALQKKFWKDLLCDLFFFFTNFLVIDCWSQYESWPLREKAKLDILHHILTNTYQIETRSHARSMDCIGNALNEGNIQLCQRCVVMD